MRPDLVRRAYRDSHTIGTHTQTHPDLAKLPLAAAEREIDDGIQSVQAALGLQMSVAPFFRAPYLQLTPDLQEFLITREVTLWSVDIDPEAGGRNRRRFSSRTHWPLLKPNDPASSCCTMFSRTRRRRCPICFANCGRAATVLSTRSRRMRKPSRSQSAAMPHRSTRGLSEPEDARADGQGNQPRAHPLLHCCWINDDDANSPSEQKMADRSHKRLLSGEKSGASDGRQLPSLTPLRGIAALWVVLYHYCGTAQYLPQSRHNSAQLYHQQGLSGRRHVFHAQRLRHGARLLSRLF